MSSEERHIRVPRTARYRVMGDPRSSEEVWFALHGYRQLAERFIRRFTAFPGIDEGRRAVVAPEGLSRFYIDDDGGEHGADSKVGATWMTRADREHEIGDYVEYLDRLAAAVLEPAPPEGASPPGHEAPEASPIRGDRGVVILGFSQGAATASRWAVYGRIQPDELVLWAGGLAADLDMAQAARVLAGVRIRFVIGDDDRWATRRVEESERRLERAGLQSERIGFPGGHGLPAEVLRDWG